MERPTRGPSILTGAVLGALTAAPLLALMFAANRLLGLPLAAFDIFEWMTRWLPAAVLTFGIEALVSVISALGVHPTAVAAKIAEEALAIALFLVGSAVLGALVVIGRRALRWPPLVLGLIAGAAWGVIAIGSQAALGRLTAGGVAWVAIVHLAWGAALGLAVGALEPAPGGGPAADATRRHFLVRLAGAVAGASAVFLALAALVRRGRTVPGGVAEKQKELLGADGTSGSAASPPEPVLAARVPAAPGTRPEITSNERFYRIDINLVPPQIDASNWRLRVEGLVDAPSSLTLDEIRALPSVSQMITLECISNRVGGDLIGTSRWTGVRLSEVLRRAGVRSSARAVLIDAADGYYESVSMADASDDRTLLVYEMNGVPLPAAHGFPLRIYIPNRYGMKQPKWITRLRASDRPGSGFWVDRGWSKEAIPHTTSVIDTVGMSTMLGPASVLPVGGIAYAGARGISRVEVQVDGGPWTAATLVAPPLGPLTWVLWRYDWPYAAGKHTFRVRAYDGQGVPQAVEERPPPPDGATGIHKLTVRV